MILTPFVVSAQTEFHLVPCGRSVDFPSGWESGDPLPDPTRYPDAHCTFRHLVILIIRLINYLISAAALVAMHRVLLGGWDLIGALGNPEKIEKGKQTISQAVVGFGIIIFAFIFVNLLANGLFGRGNTAREWFNPACIWGIGDRDSGCSAGIVLQDEAN